MFHRFKLLDGAVQKFHDWGYSIVYVEKPEDGFSEEEIDDAIILLHKLPSDALTAKEMSLLGKLKAKRKARD